MSNEPAGKHQLTQSSILLFLSLLTLGVGQLRILEEIRSTPRTPVTTVSVSTPNPELVARATIRAWQKADQGTNEPGQYTIEVDDNLVSIYWNSSDGSKTLLTTEEIK